MAYENISDLAIFSLLYLCVGMLIGALVPAIQGLNNDMARYFPERQVWFICLVMIFWPLAGRIYRHYKIPTDKLKAFHEGMIRGIGRGKILTQELLDDHKRQLVDSNT